MRKILLSLLMVVTTTLNAQPPVVYVNFVSHNEPGDQLQQLLNFNIMNTKVTQLATIINTKGAAWNLQTCDGYAAGALQHQGAASNIFRTLQSAPYADNIEIDPRNKQSIYQEIADLYKVLDSLGANPTTTLGGFLYSVTPPATGSPDWFQYEDTIYGGTFPSAKWKCDVMWGAGSLNPHTNDLNDYGIWKPDTTNNFRSHNPNRSVWYMGNGCQPVYSLDSTENELVVIDLLKGVVDSIQNGIWPQDRFYVYSITINQSQFGPTLFNKISRVCDSINAMGTARIQWMTLREKFTAFQSWQSHPEAYSQWDCGQNNLGVETEPSAETMNIFPNPASETIQLRFADEQNHSIQITDLLGKQLMTFTSTAGSRTVSVSHLPAGMYIISSDGAYAGRFIRE